MLFWLGRKLNLRLYLNSKAETKQMEETKKMYATINIPGSSHFEYYGPATRVECEAWLDRRVEKLLETQLITSTLPRRIVSNKDAESWKYLDGSRVCRMQEDV